MKDKELIGLLEEVRARPLGEQDVRDAWYDRSYDVLARAAHENDNPDGLVRVMAYAASWVSLIPAAKPTRDPAEVDRLLDSIVEASKASGETAESAYRRAIAAARKAFGLREDSESIVLLSKAMHFLRPQMVPMLDTRVGEAWEELAMKNRFLVPSSLLSGTQGYGKRRRRIPNEDDFVRYWAIAKRLSSLGQMSDPTFDYRGLDRLLFRYGKDVKADTKRNANQEPIS